MCDMYDETVTTQMCVTTLHEFIEFDRKTVVQGRRVDAQ